MGVRESTVRGTALAAAMGIAFAFAGAACSSSTTNDVAAPDAAPADGAATDATATDGAAADAAADGTASDGTATDGTLGGDGAHDAGPSDGGTDGSAAPSDAADGSDGSASSDAADGSAPSDAADATPGDGASDDGDPADAAFPGCVGLTIGSAPAVTTMMVASSAPTILGGAAFDDGLYYLTSNTVYTGVDGGAGAAGSPRATAMLVSNGGSMIRMVYSTSPSTVYAQSITYFAFGFCQLTTVCPTTGTVLDEAYTNDVTSVTLYTTLGSQTVAATYTRQ